MTNYLKRITSGLKSEKTSYIMCGSALLIIYTASISLISLIINLIF